MGLFLGLCAAFSFGTSDFLAGKSGRKIGVFATLFFMQAVGLVFLSIALVVSGQWKLLVPNEAMVSASIWMAVDLAGIVMLYQALRIGQASIVTPIASSFSVVTVVLAFLFGERLHTFAIFGIVLTFAGVLLTTIGQEKRPPGYTGKWSSTFWALGASLLLGAAFFGLRYSAEALGGVPTVWIGRLQAVLLLPLLYRAARIPLTLPGRQSYGLLLAIGILDAVALVSYNQGLRFADTAVVATGVSLFALVTLLWGVCLAGERPARWQWVGILLTLTGIAVVSIFRGELG